MFNDLNQPNQPATPTPPVDDIFADTDKTAEAKKFSGYYSNSATTPASLPTDIETQKAGLSASEDLPVSAKGKILKIGLIVLLIILLISLGYLVYIKFLSGQNAIESPTADNVKIITNVATQTPVVTDTNTIPVSEEVPVVTSTPLVTATTSEANLIDTDADGLTNQEEAVLGTDSTNKDTDGDGLSDYDEVKIYNTNPNKVDTDGDGLSDYEEVKIYKTDPLKSDTDGDGHSDGEEVKNGYNPLGAGKMTDVQKQATSTVIVN